MRTRAFFIPAIALSLAVGSLSGAIGDELPSNDHPAQEPFGDLQPFDSPRRPKATNKTHAQKSETGKETIQPNKDQTSQQKPKAADKAPKVNDLGDPERIVFEGVRLFPEQQLRLALGCDLKYQAAARPSSDAGGFLDVLEQRLLEGYLNSGCADAEVHARLGSDHNVIVLVDEGTQFRKGQIRVTGSKVISEQALSDFLTKPQRVHPWTYTLGGKRLDIFAKEGKEAKEPANDTSASSGSDPDPITIWKSGDTIDFRRVDDSQLERGIRFALADLGFIGSPFRLKTERDAKQGVANLHISILHDVPRAVVADIQITGLKRDSREALLDYLKIGPGDPLTSETLGRIDQRLSDSCRYWTHKIEVDAPSASDRYSPQPEASKVKLVVTLEEYEPVPPLGKPLSSVDETMRKCADWLNSLTKDFGSRDLVVTTAAADLGGLLQHAQFVLSPDGTTALDLQMATGDWRIDHSAIIGPHGIELYDWKHNDRFCISQKFFPTGLLSVRATHAEDGKQQARMMFGYALGSSEKDPSRTKFPINIQVEPVALLRLAHREEVKVKSHGGKVTLTDDEVELQVDETTGAVLSLKSASFLSAGISAVDLRSEPGLATQTVEKIRRRGNDCQNLCDEKYELGSAVTYAIQQIERQPSIRKEPQPRAFWHLANKVSTSNAFRRLTIPETYSMLAGRSTSTTFQIPGRPEFTAANWEEFAGYYFPFLIDKTLPRGSCLWTVLREWCFDYEDVGVNSKTNHARGHQEYTRMWSARDFGPICSLIASKIWQQAYPDSQDSIQECAQIGLHDMSDDAFLRDVRLLSDGNHGLAVLSRSLVEACGNLSTEDEDDLLQLLPPNYHGAVKALVARRKTRPDEPPGDAIRSVILDEWHKSWKSEVETRLHAIVEASSISQTDAPVTK